MILIHNIWRYPNILTISTAQVHLSYAKTKFCVVRYNLCASYNPNCAQSVAMLHTHSTTYHKVLNPSMVHDGIWTTKGYFPVTLL
jgi:hypothetical protein